MTSELARHFQRMFEYERWCTPRVVRGLRVAESQVKESGLAALAAPLDRATEVFAHVQAGKQVWLSRVSTLVGFPEEGLFPVWSIDRCEQEASALDKLWEGLVGGLDEAGLARVVSYKSTEGDAYQSSMADILTHLVNHGTYHRGQIAMLIAQTGTKPQATDFIAMTRAGA